MLTKLLTNKNRTNEQIKEHYEIEKNLANKLKFSRREERRKLYTYLYNQLFQKVSHHPQLTRKADAQASSKEVCQKYITI